MRKQGSASPIKALVLQLTLNLLLVVIFPVICGIGVDILLRTFPFITLFLTVLGTTFGSVIIFRAVTSVYQRVEGDKSE